MLKSTSCGSLRSEHADQTVTLAGWVHRRRNHGSLIFIDLRDRDGITQVVFNPEVAPDAHRTAEAFRSEWVIQVKGEVSLRPEGTENRNIQTGCIEVVATEAGLSVARTKPVTRFETAVASTPSPTLASKLFQVSVGEVTTATAAEGHLVAKMIEIVAADPYTDPDTVAAVRESLVGALRDDLLEQFLATMRGEYGVEIKEQALDELLATF